MVRQVARISRICIEVSQGKGRLIDLLARGADIARGFGRPALEKLLDPTNDLGNSGAFVDRVLAERKG